MTVGNWLRQARSKLESANISTARLDCLVLLEDATGHDRSWLLAHPEHELQIEVVKKLNKQITQRAQHKPLAYIRSKSEFYGREFEVNEHVLEPRPESETMIDLLKQLPLSHSIVIADIGTGSGALAITAKLEQPTFAVIAVDIDPSCVKVARRNAEKLGVTIQLLQGDLLSPLVHDAEHPLVLLCNLPYVPDDFHINLAATHEPHIALFGGKDGLNVYRKLFEQIKLLLVKPKFVLTEALPSQHEALARIAQSASFTQETTLDFIQVFRSS